jgi:hypothetical protein
MEFMALSSPLPSKADLLAGFYQHLAKVRFDQDTDFSLAGLKGNQPP